MELWGLLEERTSLGLRPSWWKPESRVERDGGLSPAPSPQHLQSPDPINSLLRLKLLGMGFCHLQPGALTHPILTYSACGPVFGWLITLFLPPAASYSPSWHGIPQARVLETGSSPPRPPPPAEMPVSWAHSLLSLLLSWKTLRFSPRDPGSPTHLSSTWTGA